MLWMYLIPTWLLGVLIVGTSVVLSVLGLYLLEPFIRRHPHPGNDIVYSFAAGVGVIYALVLGLFAVATWDSLKAADDTASKEALQVSKLYLDLSGYPKADRDHLRPLLRQYLSHVIKVEWPVQQKGQDPKDPAFIAEMMDYWMKVEPVTEGQKIVHTEAMQQLNELLSLRRARQANVHAALPTPLWAVVILGAIVNIAMCFLISSDKGVLHSAMVALFAAMIGVMIFVIVAVDHPMWGDVSVSPESYVQVLNRLSSESASLGR